MNYGPQSIQPEGRQIEVKSQDGSVSKEHENRTGQAMAEEAEAVTILDSWDEEWRQIPGIPGYEISDFGNARSFLSKGNFKKKTAGFPRLLKLAKSTTGYFTISLPKLDGTRGYKHWMIHHLVALAFIGPRPQGKEVAHGDGVKTNNRLMNLRYATHKENEADKRLHGTVSIGPRNGQSTLLQWQAEEMHYLASKGIPQLKIAALFEIPIAHVSAVLCKKGWIYASARKPIQ